MPLFRIDYRESASVSGIASQDAATPQEARRLFQAKNPSAKITKVTRCRNKFTTYDELVAWLKAEDVSPEDARGAVQVMEINTRPENEKPYRCPKCRRDMAGRGCDRVGDGYYCPFCRTLVQVG